MRMNTRRMVEMRMNLRRMGGDKEDRGDEEDGGDKDLCGHEDEPGEDRGDEQTISSCFYHCNVIFELLKSTLEYSTLSLFFSVFNKNIFFFLFPSQFLVQTNQVHQILGKFH